jgi:dihydroorotate dehydrogenase electron transfer subunit
MSAHPLHPTYCPDQAVHVTAPIVENVPIAHDTYRLRFAAPEIARRILPGQFVMVRLAGTNDPLIGRPLALYDTYLNHAGTPEGLDVVYFVKGKFTNRLCQMLPSQMLEVWGPLGNGFDPAALHYAGGHEHPQGGHGTEAAQQRGTAASGAEAGHRPAIPIDWWILVAGGIGQTPFLALAQELLGKKYYGDPPRRPPRALHVTLCYGARTAKWLAGVEDFRQLGVDVRLATDDGSLGHHGLVTELVQAALKEHHGRPRIVACGPEPMMAATAALAQESRVPCVVSLETPMACGIGICFSCVAPIRQADGSWDYKRTCVEGPVFDAQRVAWQTAAP